MNHLIKYLGIICCFFSLQLSFGQETKILTNAYLHQSAEDYGLSSADIEDWEITQTHRSEKSKILHVYGNQRYNGIAISKATFGLHIKNNQTVIQYDNNFINNIHDKINNVELSSILKAESALLLAIKELGHDISDVVEVKEEPTGADFKQVLNNEDLVINDIPVKLMYLQKVDESLQLVWDMTVKISLESEMLNLKVDAVTGKVLEKESLTDNCIVLNHECDKSTEEKKAVINTVTDEKINLISPSMSHFGNSNQLGCYRVYPLGVESPLHGNRQLITNPADPIASPFGWHNTNNGGAGVNNLSTQGNNVEASSLTNYVGSGLPVTLASPNGGANLVFDFPIVFPLSLNNKSEEAAVTNLFFWVNTIHDITYKYGFDEASGNFQFNNYGNGGVDGDPVEAYAQIDAICNAGFSTSPDGTSPWMTLYVGNSCTIPPSPFPSPLPLPPSTVNRDGCYDNAVIAHEYAHGVSRRLVGGATNVGSLGNDEQMGEGWSDWLGLMLTMNNTHSGSDARGIASWLFGQGLSGPGLRTRPYSTDMAINNLTYNNIIGAYTAPNNASQHYVGEVWASMLWEVTWALIDNYGFDSDFYNGNGGNNIALQLVIEGMKLTTVSPGFVNARDAILLADQNIYSGSNQCLLWNAFAKRGLGVSANQGSKFSIDDGQEAFDVPSSCLCTTGLSINTNVPSGQMDYEEASIGIKAYNTIFNGGEAIYHAGQEVVMTNGFVAENGSEFRAYIAGCSGVFASKKAYVFPEEEIDLSYYVPKSIKDNSLVKVLTVYPNPTEGILYVKIPNNLNEGELQVLDLNGVVIKKQNFRNKKQVVLDIARTASGVYFIRLLANKELYTAKLIKM